MSGRVGGEQRTALTEFEELLAAAAADTESADTEFADGASAAWPESRRGRARAGAPRGGRLRAVALGLVFLVGIGAVGIGVLLQAAEQRAQLAQVAAQGEPAERAEAPPAAEPQPLAPSTFTALAADPRWVAEVAAGTGIPERALEGYANAALRMGREQPGCGLGWNTLAAIGQVESHHGSIRGAVLGPDGRATPRIVGETLDGTHFLAVPDTDGGSLDADPVWDHAVGPMQFLPATWAEFGRSASAAATPDIDKIDDAALAAASMLCSSGTDLAVAGNWIAAIDGYNSSLAYNNEVAEAADFYGQFG